MHMYVSLCVYIRACKSTVCVVCVSFVRLRACESVHSPDTVTSPSVVVLIVQMVKLAAPTKQQTIH